MEERDYIVYLHINPKNGKVYVGITNQNVYKRWKNGHGYVKCKKFYNAILKYGWNNFEHIILCETDKDKALLLEKTLIRHYKNKNISYNITDGGEDSIPSMLGRHHTEEAKKKISEAGKRSCSEETKKRISKANLGKKVNIPRSTILKMREINIKPVLQFDLNNNFIEEYESITEAEKSLGKSSHHINCCCKGKRKTAYGYKWRYKYEYIN